MKAATMRQRLKDRGLGPSAVIEGDVGFDPYIDLRAGVYVVVGEFESAANQKLPSGRYRMGRFHRTYKAVVDDAAAMLEGASL